MLERRAKRWAGRDGGIVKEYALRGYEEEGRKMVCEFPSVVAYELPLDPQSTKLDAQGEQKNPVCFWTGYCFLVT